MTAWRLNRDSVSSDLMNDEVIAIHLGTGMYYSLRGTAAAIWQILATPVPAARIAELLAADFAVEATTAAADTARFLERLKTEDLIVADEPADSVARPAGGERRAYAAPELERFADLQDLLLLDPIHDVGAQGWPHRPPPRS